MKHTATATPCPHCRQTVLAAINSDAQETWVDPIPLTRQGELAANLTHRRTYRLDTDRRLWTTGHDRLLTDPQPGDRILAGHVCGRPVPATWVQPLPDPDPQPPAGPEVPF